MRSAGPKITFNQFPVTLIHMHMKTNYCVSFWIVAVSVTKRKKNIGRKYVNICEEILM